MSHRPAPLFVYGTLLDEAFTANLLEHPVRTEPARLLDFELLRIEGFPFPTVFFAPGETVSGRLYRGLSGGDYVRLDYYDGVHEDLFQRIEAQVVADSGDRKGPPETACVYVVTEKILRRYGLL